MLSTLKSCNIKVVRYEIISSLDSWEYIRYDAVIFAEARSSILSYLILRCIWKLSSTWKSVNLRLHLPPSSCPVQQQQRRYEREKNKYVKRGTRFGQATTKMLILISCNCYFNIYFETRFHLLVFEWKLFSIWIMCSLFTPLSRRCFVYSLSA